MVAGPTGSGKSAIAAELALLLDGEIIGADAFQIYRGLPVLTAHPSPALMERIPHHLVGVLPNDSSVDAARWASMAHEAAGEIAARGKSIIIAGGTGLYLKAFTHGLAEIPPPSPELRGRLSRMSKSELLSELAALDPDAMGLVDRNNPARLSRAIEIVTMTGKPLAESRRDWSRPPRTPCDGVVIHRSSGEMDRRIKANVDAMFAHGVIDEVRCAEGAGPAVSRAIGFREIRDLIAGKATLEETRSAIVTATRRYAKRQATWCRHQFLHPRADLTGIIDPREAAERVLTILLDRLQTPGPCLPNPPFPSR
jgi:tRNA dimethylallyltransferase